MNHETERLFLTNRRTLKSTSHGSLPDSPIMIFEKGAVLFGWTIFPHERWWRWWESNPRPKQFSKVPYVRSLCLSSKDKTISFL